MKLPRAVKIRNVDAGLFLCASTSIASLLVLDDMMRVVQWQSREGMAALACSLGFASAAVLTAFTARAGYVVALIAGFGALALFVRLELREQWNSWLYLNGTFSATVAMRIAAPVLATVALSRCLLRKRTWLSVVVPVLAVGVWFGCSVRPYRVPVVHYGTTAWLEILHSQKHGLSFQETVVSVYRDGKIWVGRQDRRLFQYRFEGRGGPVILDGRRATFQHAWSLVDSGRLRNLRTGPAQQLRAWNADGWYVYLQDWRVIRLLAFAAPPDEVKAIFQEIEQLPMEYELQFYPRDVCLGFCYSPQAALAVPER
jgi:hypothetical protein